MTYDQVVTTIMLRMGNRPDLRPQIEAELVNAQENVIEAEESFNPWFLLMEEPERFAVTEGTEYISLPSTFIASFEHGFCYATDTEGNALPEPLKFYPFDEARIRNTDAEYNQVRGPVPGWASLVGTRLYLFPILDRDTEIILRYYRRQPTITSTTEETHPLLQEASDWLIGEAGWKVALFDQHEQHAAVFLEESRKGRRRAHAKSVEYPLEQRRLHKGDRK